MYWKFSTGSGVVNNAYFGKIIAFRHHWKVGGF